MFRTHAVAEGIGAPAAGARPRGYHGRADPGPRTSKRQRPGDLRVCCRCWPGATIRPCALLRACATWQRDGIVLANGECAGVEFGQRYLSELAARRGRSGNDFSDRLQQHEIERMFDETALPNDRQPAISVAHGRQSACARGCHDAADGSTMLLQPYLPTIEREANLAAVFGGTLSHVVKKRPGRRVPRARRFGGQYRVLEDRPWCGRLAEQVWPRSARHCCMRAST